VSVHADRVRATAAQRLKGDESQFDLYSLCPAACDRLNIFQWEWISDRDAHYRDWVRRKRKPISQERGVNTSGLLEAAEEVAVIVQRELQERSSPLGMGEAVELWHARLGCLNALIYLGGNRLAKDVEMKAAPNGQSLAICLGSAKRESVATLIGDITMQGYTGCLSTFPDTHYGRGQRWPRWCPHCRSRKTNARNAAISALQRRVADSLAAARVAYLNE
jgi:hypothetical protein